MKTWLPLAVNRFVTIRLHYTWVFLFILGLWSLGQVVLPQRLGGTGGMWLGAILIMLVYVALVAVHEAGHLLVARLLHVPMPPLNIYPIGTLARIGRESVGPRRTFAVAAAGPVTSILVWFLLRAITPVPGTLGGEVVNFARSFTFMLGVINLLPGLPLDGGRMLRAMIWSGGNFDQGSRLATKVGYGIIILTFLYGTINIIDPETMLRGLWAVLLAWLLYAAGTMLERRRVVANIFSRLTARDIMVPASNVADPALTLRALSANWQGEMGENPTPVVEAGRFVGLITRSLVIDVPQGYWDERTVGETMQPRNQLDVITPSEPLTHMLPRLDLNDFDTTPLLVVENDQLVGLVDPRDVEPLLDLHDELGMSHAMPVNAAGSDEPRSNVVQAEANGVS